MTVAELLQVLRRELNDTSGIEYSDAELINYINRAQQFIVDELVGVRSPYMLREVNLTFTNAALWDDDFWDDFTWDEQDERYALLPSDFYVDYAFVVEGIEQKSLPPQYDVSRGKGFYKIVKDKIYGNVDKGKLFYFHTLPSYSTPNDAVLLHPQLIPALITLATLLAKNRVSIPATLEPALLKEMRTVIRNFASINTNFPQYTPVFFKSLRWK